MSTSSQNLLSPDFNSPNLVPLPQWGLILVEGPDAASFLQSQLSNSVLGLQPSPPPYLAYSTNASRLVGYCNPKGRLLASAWLGLFPTSNQSADRFALFISKDIAAATAKRLSMFVLRSKVTVADVSNLWNILGFYEAASGFETEPEQLLRSLQIESAAICLRIPDVMAQENSYARILIAKPKPDPLQITNPSDHAWNYLEVISAIPRIVLATQEQFVPQMINFESVYGIDFKKGCYPGQEVVARSQYRGVIKRRLQLAHFIGSLEDTPYTPGTELFHSNEPEQPAGMIVLSAPNPFIQGRIDFQVECKLEALENGEIHLASVHGPVLKLDPLPYPLIDI